MSSNHQSQLVLLVIYALTPFSKNIAYNQMMNRMLLLLVCLLLPAYVRGSCSNVCATCVNPNTYPQKTMCTSCRWSNYALVGYSCYSCDYCQVYNICGSCPSTDTSPSASDSTQLYAVIFGSIAGVIFVCVLIIFVYYQYCRGSSSHVNDLAAHQHSAVELAVPQGLKWERSERKIDRGQNCAICLDGSVSLQTKCGHLYHPKCIWEWCTKRQFTCPLCKSYQMEPIRQYCQNCSSSFIELRINAVPSVLKEAKWTICSFCKQENVV